MQHFLRLNILVVLCSWLVDELMCCGPITHAEISYRALHNYADVHESVSFDSILRENQDALEAGNAFPDTFYPSICYGGKYHAVSESAHWTPFINASINYINKQYPKPWDESTKKLVAFIMGLFSHQVADVSWHSLGIDQGFLQAMAKSNYHGVFNDAHPAGDLGGDVLNLALLNLSYSTTFGDWYVPIDDVVEIYRELYGRQVVTKTVVLVCTKILYLTRVAEKLVVKEYFPISARGSPFLLNDLYSYFLGGIEDMADWTQRTWKYFTFALENGQDKCFMPHNPIYMRCNRTTTEFPKESKNMTYIEKSGVYNEVNLRGLTDNDVETEFSGRGVIFRPATSLKRRLFVREANSLKFTSERVNKLSDKARSQDSKEGLEKGVLPKAVLHTSVDYAKLGSAFAVADLNRDGNEDVIIGSPGFQLNAESSAGVVFILYGTDDGINTTLTDIYKCADVMIPAPTTEEQERSLFGSSVAVFDFDEDEILDIAVSAPNFGSSNLSYNGKVFLYSFGPDGTYHLRGEISCEKHYCNLGSSLASQDVDGNGFSDLIIGSAFSPSLNKTQQRGTVVVMNSNRDYAGRDDLLLQASTMSQLIAGSDDYSWMGASIETKTFSSEGKSYIVVGEPGFRICKSANCSYQPEDTQAVGRAHVLSIKSGEQTSTQLQGRKQFDLMGTHMDVGRPYGPHTDVVAVSLTGADARGKVLKIPLTLEQVGSVNLYNVSDPNTPLLATFSGDRLFGRYGAQTKFADLNRDGYDDMIVAAPFRTNDFTEEIFKSQQGRVYIYFGGPKFPRGNATSGCGFFQAFEPCPGKVASNILSLGEDFARFGSRLSVVKTKNKVSLLVTASHSSRGGRLSGAVGVYEF